jgi:hypothetical protein
VTLREASPFTQVLAAVGTPMVYVLATIHTEWNKTQATHPQAATISNNRILSYHILFNNYDDRDYFFLMIRRVYPHNSECGCVGV